MSEKYPDPSREQVDRVLSDIEAYEQARGRADHQRQARQLAEEMVESIKQRPPVH